MPSPDSIAGTLAGHVGDGLAACQPQPCPPAPQVHDRGDDLRAGQPDVPRDGRPRGELALHPDLRAPAPVRPPRHGQHQAADGQQLRQRRPGRAGRGRGGQPAARRDGGAVPRRSARRGWAVPSRAPSVAASQLAAAEHGEDQRPPGGDRPVGLPAGPRQRGHDRERGEFGAVAPRPPGEQDRGGVGELAGLGVDDHHGLHAGRGGPGGRAGASGGS